MTSGSASELGEHDKHSRNDTACAEQGWICVPLVVEAFGGWGSEAQHTFSRVHGKEAGHPVSCLWPQVLLPPPGHSLLTRCGLWEAEVYGTRLLFCVLLCI